MMVANVCGTGKLSGSASFLGPANLQQVRSGLARLGAERRQRLNNRVRDAFSNPTLSKLDCFLSCFTAARIKNSSLYFKWRRAG